MKTAMKQLSGFVILCAFLSGCGGFGGKRGEKVERQALPRLVVVLPVANQSQDLAAPHLIRYFLEKAVRRKGYLVVIGRTELDHHLRQLGISEGSQVDNSNIQYVGEMVRADGLFQATLLESRIDPLRDRTLMRARFRLVETRSGKALWEKEVLVQGSGEKKVPPRGAMGLEWSDDLVRSVARSATGKLPKELVSEAAGGMPRR